MPREEDVKVEMVSSKDREMSGFSGDRFTISKHRNDEVSIRMKGSDALRIVTGLYVAATAMRVRRKISTGRFYHSMASDLYDVIKKKVVYDE